MKYNIKIDIKYIITRDSILIKMTKNLFINLYVTKINNNKINMKSKNK